MHVLCLCKLTVLCLVLFIYFILFYFSLAHKSYLNENLNMKRDEKQGETLSKLTILRLARNSTAYVLEPEPVGHQHDLEKGLIGSNWTLRLLGLFQIKFKKLLFQWCLILPRAVQQHATHNACTRDPKCENATKRVHYL